MKEKRQRTLTILGEQRTFEEGTSFLEIAKEYQYRFPHRIVLVLMNGKLRELKKTVKKDGELVFVTTAEDAGHKTYKRSMSLLLVKAVYDVAGRELIEKVRIHYSVDRGYYCTIDGDVQVTKELLEKIDARMRRIVEEDIPIQKRSVDTDDAVELFRKYGMYDKEKLFRYRRVSKVNIYSIGGFEDYYYGYMVPSAGYLKYFRLEPYDEGFVLQMPTMAEPEHVPEFRPQKKLFEVLKESTSWGDMQGIETVGALNDEITNRGAREMILTQEALQERKISEIAKEIAERKNVKFVLIAGPSSSGKTTFSHRLSVQLRVNGLVPHPLAVDNYFVNRADTPKDEFGNYDFECIEAIDINLLNKNLQELLEGKCVKLPTFDFKTGERKYNGNTMQLGENDVLVIEGIHCLNPKLTEQLAEENKFKIYISALTQLNIDEHNRIPSTDGRLIRRIVRDARTRGASAAHTISMWYSVRRGEEKNIFPYQEEADVMFNSALIYELAVLKPYVEPLLFAIDRTAPEYLEAKRLLKFLDYFVGVGTDLIPINSLVREFVGGGCFDL